MDKLQSESEDLLNIFNDIQVKNATLESLLSQYSARNTNQVELRENNEFKRVYNYEPIDFFPNMNVVPDIQSNFVDFELSEKLKKDVVEVKKKFKNILNIMQKYNKETSVTFKKLADLFSFIDLKDFATNSTNDFGIRSDDGLLIFYLAILASKPNVLTSKLWVDNQKKILNPLVENTNLKSTIAYRDSVKRLYTETNLAQLTQFASKYCKFPKLENVHTQAGLLLNLIKYIEETIVFMTSDNQISENISMIENNWEPTFLGDAFGDNINSYFSYNF